MVLLLLRPGTPVELSPYTDTSNCTLFSTNPGDPLRYSFFWCSGSCFWRGDRRRVSLSFKNETQVVSPYPTRDWIRTERFILNVKTGTSYWSWIERDEDRSLSFDLSSVVSDTTESFLFNYSLGTLVSLKDGFLWKVWYCVLPWDSFRVDRMAVRMYNFTIMKPWVPNLSYIMIVI